MAGEETLAALWAHATDDAPFPDLAELPLATVDGIVRALTFLCEDKPAIVYRNEKVFFAFVMRSGHYVCGIMRDKYGYFERCFQEGRYDTDAMVAYVQDLVPELPRMPRYVAPAGTIVPHPDACVLC